jgi:hypothetical protein
MSQLTALLSDPTVVGKLRDAAKHIGVSSIRDGSWFQGVIRAHVKSYFEKVDRGRWERLYPGIPVEERARLETHRVAVKAAAAGALAAMGASTGELVSLFTEGLAAPVGVPAALLSMALEAAFTSLLQVNLSCDLGLIYGVPFNPDDLGEIATLFGLSLEMDVYSKKEREEAEETDAPRGLMARLMQLEEGQIATRIGRKLLEDSLVRNVLPIVGVPISARWNYVTTLKLGAKVKKYMRYRHAIRGAVAKLRLGSVTDPTLLIEGGWLMATVDGEAGHEELLALAAIMDLLTPEQRQAMTNGQAFGDHEEQWFGQLATVDGQMQPALLDALYLIAAADRELAVPERRFLARVGATLGREIDFGRVEEICRHLQHGDELSQSLLTTRA